MCEIPNVFEGDYEESLRETMRENIDNGIAEQLTIKIAKELRGKVIITYAKNRAGKESVDNFVIGDVRREVLDNATDGEISLFTYEGRNTCIRAYECDAGVFSQGGKGCFVKYIKGNKK
jgi:hypothetical protein